MSARPTDDAEELWARVLTELEADLDAQLASELESELEPELEMNSAIDPSAGSGANSNVGSGMWHAPAQLPVLPESLRGRADALYRRQNERQAELLAERTQVLRHLEALRSVPRPRAATASVYLDVSG